MRLISPRIKKVRRFFILSRWQCKGGGIVGYGKCPKEAYWNWFSKPGHLYFYF